jgi:SAM-dependent methyltransferase
MSAHYDAIGGAYGQFRRPDPRIAASVLRALADAASVVNVGAGAGSYEPRDRPVVAIEPSVTMVRQRPPAAAPVVRACATALPLRDGSFDASLAILTVHHWPDKAKGLRELRRVARRRVVVLTWDPATPGFWLAEYFPAIRDADRLIFPALETLREELGRVSVIDVPIPHDCSDGFLGAYWRRPASYLDAGARSAISAFSRLPDLEQGLSRLAADLRSGEWHRRHGSLLGESALDLGYRLVVAE